MPPPPPDLPDGPISQILLRLPPDEPKWLFRAALVCKAWLGALSDPAFLAEYRAFHGAPPLLGFVFGRAPSLAMCQPYRFVPTTGVPAFRAPEPDDASASPLDVLQGPADPAPAPALPLDCRHGRILFRMCGRNCRGYYLVGDPVTGDLHRLPDDPDYRMRCKPLMAVVFCAAAGCNHVDCHGGHFCVLIVVTDKIGYGWGPNYTLLAAMYSSETGAWRAPAKLDSVRDEIYNHGPLIGDDIYFAEARGPTIVKYDRANNFLSVVEHRPPGFSFHLVVMEDASLGLAGILGGKLRLCSRRVTSEGIAEWVQCRVIDLNKNCASVVGFAEGVGVIFLNNQADAELLMMELKSGRVRRFKKPFSDLTVLPYMSFYTPDRLLGRPR